MSDRGLQDQRQIVRIPVYSEEEFVPNSFGGASAQPGQFYINCYPKVIKNNVTGEGSMVLNKRSPIKKTMALSTHFSGTNSRPFANIGMAMLNDVMVCAIWDETGTAIRIIQYRPSAGTSTLIGSISTANTTGGVAPTAYDEVFITECDLVSGGVINPGIIISWKKYNSSYSDGFWSRSSSGVFGAASLNHITAASFPVTLGKIITGPFQQLNGVFYIMGTDGVIYGSGGATGIVNDATQWDSNNTIRCRQLPDGGIGVFRYKHHIVAFSNSSVEFFNDVGNTVPASALASTEQAYINFGVFSSKQVCTIEDSLYWVGNSTSGTVGIYRLDGYTPVQVANDHLLYSLVDSNATKDISLFSLPVNGKLNLVVNNCPLPWTIIFPDLGQSDTNISQSPSSSQTSIMMYNIADKVWWTLTNDFGDHLAILPAQWTNYNYPAKFTYVLQEGGGVDGRTVYKYDESYNYAGQFTDSDGAASETLRCYPCLVKFGQLSFNNLSRKRVSKAQIPLLMYPRESGSDTEAMYLGVAFDNSNTQDINWMRKELPTASSYPDVLEPVYYNNLGTGRQMTYYIYYYGKGYFAPIALELTVAQGVH